MPNFFSFLNIFFSCAMLNINPERKYVQKCKNELEVIVVKTGKKVSPYYLVLVNNVIIIK